ncbi:hypothetical protein C1H46_012123 [Malus baccata]|uniref:Uncharacterized protein n=1 Tax=Malus baccata TaxID=106549 RepID=A0A540MU02_MALBA|nr:hypothetical protein C1H46_012123 [Malus baccata]
MIFALNRPRTSIFRLKVVSRIQNKKKLKRFEAHQEQRTVKSHQKAAKFLCVSVQWADNKGDKNIRGKEGKTWWCVLRTRQIGHHRMWLAMVIWCIMYGSQREFERRLAEYQVSVDLMQGMHQVDGLVVHIKHIGGWWWQVGCLAVEVVAVWCNSQA